MGQFHGRSETTDLREYEKQILANTQTPDTDVVRAVMNESPWGQILKIWVTITDLLAGRWVAPLLLHHKRTRRCCTSCQGQDCLLDWMCESSCAVATVCSFSLYILMLIYFTIKQGSSIKPWLEALLCTMPTDAPWLWETCRHSGCNGLYWIRGVKKTYGRKLNQKCKMSGNRKETSL